MQTKEEVIEWARTFLKAEGKGRWGVYHGETENGFYITFWKPDFKPTYVDEQAISTAFPVPGGSTRLFISKARFGIIHLESPPPVPCLMFDHYMSARSLSPVPALDANGTPIKYGEVNLYVADQEFMIQEMFSNSTHGLPVHLKYGEFSTPQEVIEPI